MATKIPWDIKESIILLHATIEVEDGKENRGKIVKNVSSDLRKLAQSRGLHIDESYRNENGISLQMSNMLFAYTNGEKGLECSTKLFYEAVEIYNKNRTQYEQILSAAKKEIEMVNSSISTLKDKIEKIINEYIQVKKEVFAGNSFGAFVRNDIPNAIYGTGIVDSTDYLVTGSVGQGNWAMVPWVCIFDRKVTTTAQKGVYIVYLLSKDGKSLYLTFNQGCTDLRHNNSKKETIKIMRERAKEIVARIDSRGFKTDENISLGEGLTELGELYQKGTIFYKEYKQGLVPEEQELRNDLQKMMDIYREYVNQETEDTWWPSLQDYTPDISKEQWIALLEDPKIIGPVWGEVLAMFYTEKVGATCKFIEQKFGKKAGSVNPTCMHLAKCIQEKTSRPIIESEDNPGQKKYWPILFQGRDAKKDEPGTWVWRLRSELYDALTEVNILRFLPKGGEEEMKTKDILEKIKQYIADKGFTYKDNLVENFYLSLKSKPFVILAGTSGTGKTKLVKLFAEAIGANYKLVSVRPDWSDSSDLFGHVNLKNEFVPGAIIDYVKRAELIHISCV